jgi:predicted SnoaL-like aldol condensation-catalyzing enzyme
MLKVGRFLFVIAFLALISVVVKAQEPVVGVADPEKLFTSPDPKLNANKQAALHIVRDLLECGHWDEADKYLTKEYLQHNPLVVSGRDPVVKFFTGIMKPKPIPAKMTTKIVAVIAEGDLVMVAYPREYPDPKDPSKKYTTTWFDMWRFVDGKAAEHWDNQTK